MDIQPLLTRYGCNAGACHGKSRGQNGFALSLLGFDSDQDYESLVTEARGRRIAFSGQTTSLLLQKATGLMPHAGGKRFETNSPAYRLLSEWIAAGSPRTPPTAPQLTQVRVEPQEKALQNGEKTNLKVFALYSDGSKRDVTEASAFQSQDSLLAQVSPDGMVQAGKHPGEAAIMARYMNRIAVSLIQVPMAGESNPAVLDAFPIHSEIDRLVLAKWKRLGLEPSPMAQESTFHRRAFLRIIGRLPTPSETREYLESSHPGKKEKLLSNLLELPEYADFWANKWADLLRPNPYRAGIKAVWNLDAWLRQNFRENKAYDRMVKEILTAQGSSWKDGAVVPLRDRPEPVELASEMSQLFLGVRLDCAKCHHHPFEIWSQDDFYGFAAFFARIGHKGEGLSPPISGGEELIFAKDSGQILHGRTKAPVSPRYLKGAPLTLSNEADPREKLAEWMLAPDNPFFARAAANRIWKEIMGVGLVEPVDDLRATNPASNEPLLDHLAQVFRQDGYDIKKLIKRIASSSVFGLSTTPGPRNRFDFRNFSRAYRERMRAEVLLDAVNDVLDVEDGFAAMPPGSRAIQLWTFRAPSVFLDTFGRPDPNLDPPCERNPDTTTPQVLHLMNSPQISQKIAQTGARPDQFGKKNWSEEQILRELYLLAYCRNPSEKELAKGREILRENPNKKQAIEDLFWAILNTPEFWYID